MSAPPHQLRDASTSEPRPLLIAFPPSLDRSLSVMAPMAPAVEAMLMPSPVLPVMKFWVAEVRAPPVSTLTPVPFPETVLCCRLARDRAPSTSRPTGPPVMVVPSGMARVVEFVVL